MGLEDKHLGILQNIEFMILSVYHENGEMKDKHAIKALGALIDHYKAIITKKSASEPAIDVIETTIYNRVIDILNERKSGFDGILNNDEEKSRKRFSRGFKEQTQDEIFLACLRKLEKSAKRWTQRHGLTGYLDFINDYVK